MSINCWRIWINKIYLSKNPKRILILRVIIFSPWREIRMTYLHLIKLLWILLCLKNIKKIRWSLILSLHKHRLNAHHSSSIRLQGKPRLFNSYSLKRCWSFIYLLVNIWKLKYILLSSNNNWIYKGILNLFIILTILGLISICRVNYKRIYGFDWCIVR